MDTNDNAAPKKKSMFNDKNIINGMITELNEIRSEYHFDRTEQVLVTFKGRLKSDSNAKASIWQLKKFTM